MDSLSFQQQIFQQQVFQQQLVQQRTTTIGESKEKIEVLRPCMDNSSAGTLYIDDTFTPSAGSVPIDEKTGKLELDPRTGKINPIHDPHGFNVARSARHHGFHGRVVGSESEISGAQLRSLPIHESLFDRCQTSQQFLTGVRGYASNRAAGLLDQKSAHLEGLSRRGIHNSAINFSQGDSKADVTLKLYREAEAGWRKDVPKDKIGGNIDLLSNFVNAFGLDRGKLESPDPKVSGPERRKLQQGILAQVNQGFDKSPGVAQARTRYDSAVNKFEASKNSVVIAGSNAGEFQQALEKRNGGYKLDVPADFSRNILENDQVTSVGATQWLNGLQGLRESRAGYTSHSAGIDIYASGSLGLVEAGKSDGSGTSFAAPRVAAAMAGLHRQHPNLTSGQIENLMKNQLTHPLQNNNGTIPVLDYEKTSNFLSRLTY